MFPTTCVSYILFLRHDAWGTLGVSGAFQPQFRKCATQSPRMHFVLLALVLLPNNRHLLNSFSGETAELGWPLTEIWTSRALILVQDRGHPVIWLFLH